MKAKAILGGTIVSVAYASAADPNMPKGDVIVESASATCLVDFMPQETTMKTAAKSLLVSVEPDVDKIREKLTSAGLKDDQLENAITYVLAKLTDPVRILVKESNEASSHACDKLIAKCAAPQPAPYFKVNAAYTYRRHNKAPGKPGWSADKTAQVLGTKQISDGATVGISESIPIPKTQIKLGAVSEINYTTTITWEAAITSPPSPLDQPEADMEVTPILNIALNCKCKSQTVFTVELTGSHVYAEPMKAKKGKVIAGEKDLGWTN